MDQFLCLITCRACDDGRTLSSPTTLPCGHSICSKGHDHCFCGEPVLDEPKVDVTLNKIVTLINRTVDDAANVGDDDDDGDLLARFRTKKPSDRFNKELLETLTCEICYQTHYQPTTTRCQHTFCARCLYRCLDHSPSCPLCRETLPGYLQDHPFNEVILSLILEAFPDTYEARKQSIETEERDARLDTPIFVCHLSFPGMPTLLHFFEPRYRLMLRRCLEAGPGRARFGMIMPSRPGSSATVEYGTMLEIRSVQTLNDGRSMVETWGTYRFRILERGSLDGYMVGRVEQVSDIPDAIEDDSSESSESDDHKSETRRTPPAPVASSSTSTLETRLSSPTPSRRRRRTPQQTLSIDDLIAHCLDFLNILQNGTPWVSQRLGHTYGYGVYGPYAKYFTKDADGNISLPLLPPRDSQNSNTPEQDEGEFDLASFSYWVGAVIPIDDWEKAKLLPVRSVRMRLQMCVWWIESLRRHWWFSSGCIIL